MTGRAGTILAELSERAMHLDELARRTGLSPARLQSELLELEMSGRIVQHPGKLFSLS